MPEGDTIYRTAARLRPVLVGKQLTTAITTGIAGDVPSLVGQQVTAVEARGKHLLIRTDNGWTIHTHLGMTGSWHIYAADESWRKPPHRAALVLATGGSGVSVCFSPKTCELLTDAGLRRHRWLSQLGPDILADDLLAEARLAGIVAALRQHGVRAVGDVILDQRIVSGIGNVYKSEVLFLEQLCPRRPVKDFSDDQLQQLVKRARKLMRSNLAGYPRRTRRGQDGSRIWVYGRQGQPCLKCGDMVVMERQGQLGRSTYWCPTCQDAARANSDFS